MSASNQDKPVDKSVLDNLRQQLNGIDDQILDLLSSRRQISAEVAKSKAVEGTALRDPKREQEILVEHIRVGKQKGLDAYFVTKVFHEIIDDSVRLQLEYLQSRANADQSSAQISRVAFHGIEGSYSH